MIRKRPSTGSESARPRRSSKKDVDAGVAARADRQDHGVVGVEGLDVAELQRRGAGRRDLLPGRTLVDRAQDRAEAAARPGHIGADRRHSAEPRIGSGGRQVPAVGRAARRHERHRRRGDAEQRRDERDPLPHGAEPYSPAPGVASRVRQPTSTTTRGGDVRALTLNGRCSLKPTTHVRTASKSPLFTTFRTNRVPVGASRRGPV